MKNKNRSMILKAISLIIIISILIPYASFAAVPEGNNYITGTYHYGESFNKDADDSFIYSDKWFCTNSTTNIHIACMSLILAMSSADVDKSAQDQAENVKKLLMDCGFKDFDMNEYYSIEPTDTSFACCAAQKTIISDDKEYTLIALVPRSTNYIKEWVGNFTAGKNGLHENFEKSSNIVISFLAQYIDKLEAENKLKDNVKVWISGHSRGAAVANLAEAFIIDHADLFGYGKITGKPRLNPSNMYFYNFETPAGVPSEMIEGYEEKYSIIKNFISQDDPVPMLMPSAWGMTYFGETIYYDSFTDENLAEKYIASAYPSFRDNKLVGQNPEDFSPSCINQAEFLQGIVDKLASVVGGNGTNPREYYVNEGYQDTLGSLLRYFFGYCYTEELMQTLRNNIGDVISAILWLQIFYPYDRNVYNSIPLLYEMSALSSLLYEGRFSDFEALLKRNLPSILSYFGLGDSNADEISYEIKKTCASASLIMLNPFTDIEQKRETIKSKTSGALGKVLTEIVNDLPENQQQANSFLLTPTCWENTINIASILLNDIPTLILFIRNIGRLGNAHTHVVNLSCLRAADNLYITTDKAEGSYDNTQFVKLTSAKNTKIYYTTNGNNPTENSHVYCPSLPIILLKGTNVKDYTIKAISVFEENGLKEISPVWTFHYSIGNSCEIDAVELVDTAESVIDIEIFENTEDTNFEPEDESIDIEQTDKSNSSTDKNIYHENVLSKIYHIVTMPLRQFRRILKYAKSQNTVL